MEQQGFTFIDQETGDGGYCSVRVTPTGLAKARVESGRVGPSEVTLQ